MTRRRRDKYVAKAKRPGAPGPTDQQTVLRVLRELSDRVVERAVDRALKQGRPASCRQGCAACCRQLVPVGRAEAERLRQVVAELSAAKRARVLAGMAVARQQMRAIGLERLGDSKGMAPLLRSRDPRGQYAPAAQRYHARWIDCPFLHDEQCEIYSERPLACRQYLVTSPAERCDQPDGAVEALELDTNVYEALAALEAPTGDDAEWVALPYALEWAASK